jgi:mRNA-degrading endonuclease RelE of RelBE toxin-antitoxin system
LSLWTVELNRRASKDFRELDFNGKESARDMMAELEEEGPAIHGAIEMRANPDTWRVRFNNERYRMIYRVSRGRKEILVTRMRPRRIAYKGMRN